MWVWPQLAGAGPASQPENPLLPTGFLPLGDFGVPGRDLPLFPPQDRTLPARSHPLLGSRVFDVETMMTWTMRSASALPGGTLGLSWGSPCAGRVLRRCPACASVQTHRRLRTTLAQASAPVRPLVRPQNGPSLRGTPCNLLLPEDHTTPLPPRQTWAAPHLPQVPRRANVPPAEGHRQVTSTTATSIVVPLGPENPALQDLGWTLPKVE